MTSEIADIEAAATDGRSTTAVVASLDELAEGTMKLARVGERRIALIRTSSGVHALDNSCPHQGYGLVTGALDGELLTCQWHNWKFRVADGACVLGEEDVPCHQVHIHGTEVSVTVTEPTPAQARAQLWPSLERGFENDYVGQMARDTARLLRADASPEDIVWRGIQISSPKDEDGIGHGMAMAADCLALTQLYADDDRTLPVVQALSGLSESTRDRPRRPLPTGDAAIDLVAAIEDERVDDALSSTIGQLEAGADTHTMLSQYIQVISRHHIGYGHGAIYTQKAFELLERVGWNRAGDLLPWLTLALTSGTREDTLPYMRKALRAIDAVDLETMVTAADRSSTGWSDADGTLRATLLDSPDAPIDQAVRAVLDGAGVAGLLDTVTLAVSDRLIRYDPAMDFAHDTDFGWLDITHGLTYARAARWAWSRLPSPETARLALFTVFLAHDTGRAERWAPTSPEPASITPRTPLSGDLTLAIRERRPQDAMAYALGGETRLVGEELARASLEDGAGSFIVAAHVVKLSHAALEESVEIGSNVPLAAAARFAAAPRLERFVARNVAEAIDFVRTGTPPKR